MLIKLKKYTTRRRVRAAIPQTEQAPHSVFVSSIRKPNEVAKKGETKVNFLLKSDCAAQHYKYYGRLHLRIKLFINTEWNSLGGMLQYFVQVSIQSEINGQEPLMVKTTFFLLSRPFDRRNVLDNWIKR